MIFESFSQYYFVPVDSGLKQYICASLMVHKLKTVLRQFVLTKLDATIGWSLVWHKFEGYEA